MNRSSSGTRLQTLRDAPGDALEERRPGSPVSMEEEYRAAREHVALRDASPGGRLRIHGADALDLLHRLSTNNLNDLNPGQMAWTVLASNKGRVLDHLRVCRLEDHLLVLTSPQTQARVIEWLDQYTFLEEVNVTDITGETGVLQLVGPRAPAFLERVAEGPASPGETWVAGATVAGVPLVMVRDGYLGVPTYDLVVAASEMARLREVLLKEGKRWGLLPLGEEAFEVVRIEAAAPLYGREISERVNPLEAGLRPSISFAKGCYIGQEVVLRLDTYRKVQRHLVRLEVEGQGVPPSGAALVLPGKEKPVGAVTSAAWVPGGKRSVALGLLRTAHARMGQQVEIVSPGNRWNGLVHTLEQYSGEGTGQ